MNIQGWLIYNGGLRAPKYMELNTLYAESAQRLGIDLKLIANNEIYACINRGTSTLKTLADYPHPDFVLFLDKDIRLAKQLEILGYKLFNSSQVIEYCDDKTLTFQMLANKGLALPKTLIAPLAFHLNDADEVEEDFIQLIESEFGYPLIIKEAFGSFGQQVYLIHHQEELKAKHAQLRHIPHLYQEFIASSSGRDVRIYVVGGQVVTSMYRHSDSDFRANVSSGASMMPYTPNEAFCQLAISASNLIGADFTGVDLLFGPNEEPILCEVNSNAHIKNILDCTHINVADFILNHILKHIS